MQVLEAFNIKKYYGDRLIIAFDGLKIYSGEKIGIVGQNGSGKTTLMNILSGETEPDEGTIRRYCDISYIRQFSDEMIDAGEKELKEFSLSHVSRQEVFSGGEKTRIKIANAFSSEQVLLFADEPVANLDYKGIELLRHKLSGVETFLLISHDRLLLDSLCNRILEVKDGKIKLYNGNYTSYKEQKELEYNRSELEYDKYISERTNLEAAITNRKSKAKSIRKMPTRMGNSEARLHRRSSNEIQEKINNAANGLKIRLEKLEVKEKPRELPKIKLDFSLTSPPENKIVISSEKFNFCYGSREIFNNACFKLYNGSKTALWGENGSGKTTLLNLIAGKGSRNDNNNDSIYIVPKAVIGYFYQGFENLEEDKTALENVMLESVQSQTVARTILARLLISGDDVYKKVAVLSGGEKIKVSFAKLFLSKANILLLDEPTNYLDMQSIEALEDVLHDYEGTILFVSHDRAFVNKVADRLLVIEDKGIKEFAGSLDEFEAGRQKVQTKSTNETEQIIMQMRLAEVISKISRNDANKDDLEEEYQRLVAQLRE